MKAILQSIKPKYVAKILNGLKTIEIRKTAPKEWVEYLSGKSKEKPKPITVYIYCTKDDGSKRFNLLKDKCDEYHLGWEYTSIGNENVNDIISKPLNSKVLAKYTLEKIEQVQCQTLGDGVGSWSYYYTESINDIRKPSALDHQGLRNYLGIGKDGEQVGYAYHISDLQIFDKPKEISEFRYWGCLDRVKQAPQSWCYVEEL